MCRLCVPQSARPFLNCHSEVDLDGGVSLSVCDLKHTLRLLVQIVNPKTTLGGGRNAGGVLQGLKTLPSMLLPPRSTSTARAAASAWTCG